MLFYFYNKILNLAIVLKLQYVFPPLNNKGVLYYWEEVQIINWWWVIIHAPLPDQAEADAASLLNKINVRHFRNFLACL